MCNRTRDHEDLLRSRLEAYYEERLEQEIDSSRLTIPTISDKPSEAIRQALQDLEKIENTPGYRINMNHWYQKDMVDINEKGDDVVECQVCLAGAVMAMAGQPSEYLELSPHHFHDVYHKLTALDRFRCGDIIGGMEIWYDGQKEPDRSLAFSVKYHENNIFPVYEENKAGFKAVMHRLADDLEAEGL